LSRHSRRARRIRRGGRGHRLTHPHLDKEGRNCVTNYEETGFRDYRSGGEWNYRRRTGQAWETELERVEDRRTRRALGRRLEEFLKCGQVVLVRTCGECGHDREGSGTFEGTRTCKCRACASCGTIRARRVGEFMGEAYDRLRGDNGYRWQMVVITIRYDPEDEKDLSARGLRSRALLAEKAAKRAWEKVLKARGAGMLRSIEVSHRGHVHANLIYFGPPIEKDELDEVVTADDCRVGYTKVQALDCDPAPKKERVPSDDPRGSRKAVEAAARYVSKGLESRKGSNSEDWMAGEMTARCVDPVLAARWEIASYRLHLLQRYGALRGMKLEEHGKEEDESGHEDDGHVKCAVCGAVGAWKSVFRRTDRWLAWCHARGSPGLAKSTWKPPPEMGDEYYR
jgi:hypothetical protein